MRFSTVVAGLALSLGMSNVLFRAQVPAAAGPTAAPRPLILRLVTFDGATPLADVADPAGTVTSLRDIYERANIDVRIDAQSVRPYSFRAERITEAELLTLHGEPQSAGTGWKVTAFMLREAPSPGVLGVLVGPGRNQFAVFTGEHEGTGRRIMRTTAHELGHTLNLFHSDGDRNPCCGGASRQGRSLMHQDDCLSPAGWTLGFSTEELDHLMNHPAANIEPGPAVPFGECTDVHRKVC